MLDEMNPDVGLDRHGHRTAVWASSMPSKRPAPAPTGSTAVPRSGGSVGNAHLDPLLVNFRLLGWIDTDLRKLHQIGDVIAEGTGIAIPANYPVLGKDAFRTATGVHAAAVIKAKQKSEEWLANRVYSGVPAEPFGCEQVIEVGPMSRESNVVFWLRQRGIDPRTDLVKAVLVAAKQSSGFTVRGSDPPNRRPRRPEGRDPLAC